MSLFLSWSTPSGRRAALILREWLSATLPQARAWMFGDEIGPDRSWDSAHGEMSQSIVCVTAESMHDRWLSFEAGALTRSTAGRVRAVLVGLRPGDVVEPFAHFRSALVADEVGMWKLSKELNDDTGAPLEHPRLIEAFKAAWRRYEDPFITLHNSSAGARTPPGRVARATRPRSAGDGAIMPGGIVVDFSEIDETLGARRFPVSDGTRAHEFLNSVYRTMDSHVAPWTYATRWELYDIRTGTPLPRMGSGWAAAKGRTVDDRLLTAAGLRDGKTLAARLLAARTAPPVG